MEAQVAALSNQVQGSHCRLPAPAASKPLALRPAAGRRTWPTMARMREVNRASNLLQGGQWAAAHCRGPLGSASISGACSGQECKCAAHTKRNAHAYLLPGSRWLFMLQHERAITRACHEERVCTPAHGSSAGTEVRRRTPPLA